MPDPLADIDWKGLAGTILGTVRIKVVGYLKDHQEAEQFLIKCSEQIAKLTLRNIITSDPATKADIADEINAYKQAMVLEADAVIIDAEGAAKSTIMSILETTFDVLVKVAPILLKAI